MAKLKDKNQTSLIALWLDSNIKELAKDIEAPYLITELCYLIETLPKSFRVEFESEIVQLSSWIDQYTSQLPQYSERKNTDHKALKASLSKNIKIRYAIAFLANRGSSEKVNVIRSLYFFISLRLITLTNHDSRIETTLNECRFLTNKTRHFLVQFLPDLTYIQSLNELLSWLKDKKDSNHYSDWSVDQKDDIDLIINRYYKSCDNQDNKDVIQTQINEKISECLYEYILPIEYVFKRDSGITRNRKNTDTYLTIEANKHFDEITGNTVSDITFISDNISDTSAFEAQERQDDEEQSHQAVSFKEPQNYYLDFVRAEQQVNCRHQRALSQKTDVNNAHRSDIQILLQFLVDQLSIINIKKTSDNGYVLVDDLSESDRQIYQSYIFILILLLTGNSKVWLSDDLKNTYPALNYRIDFKPTRSLIDDNWDTFFCAENEEHLLIYLPVKVGKMYDCLVSKDENISTKAIEQIAVNIIKELNIEHGTKLTVQRIKGYLSHYLNQEGHDQAVIDILTNQPINHLSSLPYFNVSQIDIFMCQAHFNEHLKELIDFDNRSFIEIVDDKEINYWNKKIGTALAVKDQEIQKVIFKLKSEIIELFKTQNLQDLHKIIQKHNVFNDYLYLMLSISTGYRPVKEPFGRLKHIDANTGKYFISDKENHKTTQGRFVYLPEISCKQVKAYKNYLSQQNKLLTRFDIDVADIYKNILDSKTGIITYLRYDSENESVKEVELTQSYILERQKNLINLPLNWYRHYIRSYKPDTEAGMYSLSSHSLSEHFGYDVINAWMGHADALGYDFFDRYSGLSSSEMKRLSKKFNDILSDLDFECIEL